MPWTLNARQSSSRSVPTSRGHSRPGSPVHDSDDHASDYLGTSFSSSSALHLGTPSRRGSDGIHSPSQASQSCPLAIVLDSDQLVLRGQGGDLNPAQISGYVSLWLNENMNIKDITLSLTGKSKVQISQGSSHSNSQVILQHDWSFLEGNTGKKKHTHTLKPGLHNFPFTYTLEGSLPASLETYSGDGHIEYRLRATAIRTGLSFNLSASRTFHLMRSFTPEALEFNQTLEIENTWPGKVMYSITIPFKAYAAGDQIPVLVKFQPVAKGVRVMNVSSVIKEYSSVNTRLQSHADDRVAIAIKHELRDGRAYEVDRELARPPQHWEGMSQMEWSRRSSAANTRPASPIRDQSRYEGAQVGPSSGAAARASGSTAAGAQDAEVDDDFAIGDNEISTFFFIPIPPWTTPTHPTKPVVVSHKIKWSCAISNADGHVSELRCALPIIILDNALLEEARQSSSATRALLVGGVVDEAERVDLPSYSNHVYDRLAFAGAGNSSFSGFRTAATTPHHSPGHTPPGSRPGSPTRRLRELSISESGPRSRNHSFSEGHEGHADNPPRRELGALTESSLLRSLGSLASGPSSHSETPGSASSGNNTPHESRSRSHSRAGSRSGSRAGSRNASPERHHSSTSDDAPHERRSLGGLLHLKGKSNLKPLSALTTPILRSSAQSGSSSVHSSPVLQAQSPPVGSPLSRNGASFLSLTQAHGGSTESSSVRFAASALTRPMRGASQSSSSSAVRRGTTFNIGPSGDETPEDDEVTTLSRVPSYDNESTAAFVVPLDPSLPSYDDSERQVDRARSDTALMSLAAQEEEHRAAVVA